MMSEYDIVWERRHLSTHLWTSTRMRARLPKPERMDIPDIAFQILIRVGHKTLLKLYDTPLWQFVRPLLYNQSFWQSRCEFLLGHSLNISTSARWINIYAVLRLRGPRVLEPVATGPMSMHVDVPICAYALDDVAVLGAVLTVHGVPDWNSDSDLVWIWSWMRNPDVMLYLIREQGLPLTYAGHCLASSALAGRLAMISAILALQNVDQFDIGYAANQALTFEQSRPMTDADEPGPLSLLIPHLTREGKKKLLYSAVKRGDVRTTRLLLEEPDAAKPHIALLKKAINRRHLSLIAYLLPLFSPTPAILALASRAGPETFALVLRDPRVDPTLEVAAILEAAKPEERVRVTNVLLQHERFSIRPDSKQLRDLLLFLKTDASSDGVMGWLERHNTGCVAEAISSVVETRLPTMTEAEPIRALILALLYPTRELVNMLLDMHKEGVYNDSLVRAGMLLRYLTPQM